MMVTFVSQCEKKALNRTRRVLDSFADRIGDNTWQTVITQQGLGAVKKLLRKTASKNTAVACHQMRSRKRTELVWVVGQRSKFNQQGVVPVNTTKRPILKNHWENDWHYLPLIKSLAELAALFHDWGKSSELFQAKLRKNTKLGDPLRHEWISVLFFNAFVNGESDEQWLDRLMKGEIPADKLKQSVEKITKPLAELPNAAGFVAWLVATHHRLPEKDDFYGKECTDFKGIFKMIKQDWGYENKSGDGKFEQNLKRCYDYPKGLPSDSSSWSKRVKRSARKIRDCLPLLEKSIENGSWRLVLHYSRLSLMLGDHYYSSLEPDSKKRLRIKELDLFANTGQGKLKQSLDEHLVGVAKQAVRTAHLLPAFEGNHDELRHAFDTTALKRKSLAWFRWQDVAVTRIIKWRDGIEKLNPGHFGFFAVNMASTGKGKTFANAKIMRALSVDKESLRFVLALGLRTLTLQTGDEYRERVGLKRDELAVLIGSQAVMDLHNKNKSESHEQTDAFTGSESQESLLDNELYFEHELPEGDLATVLHSEKNRQFLFAPVLSCTIDHLMGATETRRGGRYILPSLRLMSSDLVIDEIDDFTGNDLIAIGRLIHLAGMLGRKVMISSATIPPDLAEGYYNAYQAGWKIFAGMRDYSTTVGCVWVDEFTTQTGSAECIEDYKPQHQRFIDKRIKELNKQPARRRANIVPCEPDSDNNDTEESIRHFVFSIIQKSILDKHGCHHIIESQSGKRVSFGVVRVANITPCVELTRYLLNADWPDNVEIRAMAYHSQQVLLMRHEQEKHLDDVLKRSKGEQCVFENTVIKNHLKNINSRDVIFILVATPVEEIGRDHDFDWAVVEPSSYRSIIQLAGRVLRHRESAVATSNIALLQYNLKGVLHKDEPVFCRPGYETREDRFGTHDLEQLVNVQALGERVDAQPRINRSETLNPKCSLIDLEHESTHKLLTDYCSKGPETLQGWLTGCWWLTAIPQHYVRFRNSHPQDVLFLAPIDNDDDFRFCEKYTHGKYDPQEKRYKFFGRDEGLSDRIRARLWLYRDYKSLLEKIENKTIEKAALIYGEINLPIYGKDRQDLSFTYSSQFGLVKS